MSTTDERLAECQAILDYAFLDVNLLRRALIHASSASTRGESNERFEFLGDAVFGAVVCDELFRRFPDKAEGELTKIKSAVVSRAACTRVTKAMGLSGFVVLGKGVASRSGRIPGSILAAVYEAIVAAIYLDSGFDSARRFILRTFEEEIASAADDAVTENYKSQLQQRSQRDFGTTPTYEVIDERGPDHLKSFLVRAAIDARQFNAAWGPNKKLAEQKAAENALLELDGHEHPQAADDT